MSKDLVKLNWDLVKQADSNASKHNEVQQKVANIGEYLQDPDVQNALLAGGAGALGGAVASVGASLGLLGLRAASEHER